MADEFVVAVGPKEAENADPGPVFAMEAPPSACEEEEDAAAAVAVEVEAKSVAGARPVGDRGV